jgi:hypothetical protein
MGQAVGKVTVIGQQQQTLGRHVEPSDRKNSFFDINEINDGTPSPGVAPGCDYPRGFVQDHISLLRIDRNPVTIESYLVARGIDLHAEYGGPPVHRDSSLSDKVLGRTA